MLTDEERAQIQTLIRQAKYPLRQVAICCQLYACSRREVLECLPDGFEWIRNRVESTTKSRCFSSDQKLEICRRYMRGDAKKLQFEFGIGASTLRSYVSNWKTLFPDEKWPGRTNEFTRQCCLEWLSGVSSREIARRMGTSSNSARGRMRNYMKHHPDEFIGIEDKRGQKGSNK